MTAAERTILGHAIALVEALGKKPSIRGIAAIIETAHGKKAMRWQTIAEALKVLPGNTSGNTPATPGQQIDEAGATPGQQSETATCAPADLSRVVKAGGEYQDSIPPPPPAPAVGDADPVDLAPALFAVPDLPAKPTLRSVAEQDPNTNFGAFEADVVAMIAVEQAAHPRKKPAEGVIRQRLALLWRKHGDDAFARGLEVGVSSGNGVNYGRAVMERFDPDAEGRRFDRPAEGNASDALPTLTELIAAGKSAAINSAAVLAERPAWFNQQIAATA